MKNHALIHAFQRRALPAALACLTLPSLAQSPAPAAPILETTLVIGQAASLNEALENQREARNIKTVVNADAIGQFPDANVSEALQRLPGLSIERDQGEGRFVRVRGLGPNMNAVNINGVRVPSPESGSRAVALDVIPSDLLDSLEVSKTLTPDMDADSLGGAINVKSVSAFDRDGTYYSASVDGSYDEHTGETSPKAALSGSGLFGAEGRETLGVAAAISWFERDFGSDNVETGGAWERDDGLTLLEEVEQRDYTITRERFGATLNFDWRPGGRTDVYFRNLYSEYTDSEIRLANIIELEGGDGLPSDTAGTGAIGRELKDREETLEIFSTSLGAVTRLESWTLEYSASYSESSETTPFHLAGAVFEADDIPNVAFTGTRIPRLTLPAAALDPALFELDEVEMAEQKTEDEEVSLRLDLEREASWGSVRFGVKWSQRDKYSDENVWVFEDLADYGLDDDSLSLSAHVGPFVEHEFADMGRSIRAEGIRRLVDALNPDGFVDEEETRVGDFDVDEDTGAAYLMATWERDNLQVLGGARYETTRYDAAGTGLNEGSYQPLAAENDYGHWLPSLHLRYSLTEKTQVRAAWGNSLVRPTFEQLAPGFIIEGDEASFGNPELEPLESSNLDLGIEHYTGYASMMSAFVFHKDVDNFVYATDVAGTPGYEAFDEAETFRNGDSARIYGLELAWYRQMRELPAPWNGVMVGANGTWTRSEADITFAEDGITSTREIVFPSQSDLSYNLMLGYENDRVSLRLAANYKSEYLVEVEDFTNPDGDIYADEHLQVDLLARYYVTQHLQVYFQGINLNDEPYYTYAGHRSLNAQYEEYGPTYKVGISISNF